MTEDEILHAMSKLTPMQIEAITNLTDMQVDDARDWFDECDVDGNEELDEQEVFDAMRKLYGPRVTKEMVSKLFKTIDVDGSGDIDFVEFLVFVAEAQSQDSAGAFGSALLGGGSGVDRWAPKSVTTVCPEYVAAGKTGQLLLDGDLLHVRWPTDATPGSQAKFVLGENAFRVLLDKPDPKTAQKGKAKSKREQAKEAKVQRKAREKRLAVFREELEAKLEAQEEKERGEESDMPDDQREKREEQRDQRRVEVFGKLEATGEQQEVPPLAAPTPPDESTGSDPTGDDAADADDDGDYDETEAEPQQEEAAAGSSVSSFFGFGDATPQVEPDPPAPPIAADAPSGSSFFGFFGGGDPEPPKAEEPPAVQPAQPPAAPKFDVNTGEPIPAAPRFDVHTGQPIPKFDVHTGKQNW